MIMFSKNTKFTKGFKNISRAPTAYWQEGINMCYIGYQDLFSPPTLGLTWLGRPLGVWVALARYSN